MTKAVNAKVWSALYVHPDGKNATFPPPNQGPTWALTPAPSFFLGTPASIPLSAYCVDPENDAITYVSDGTSLSGTGVSVNNTTKSLDYDGVGPITTIAGVRITATSTGGSARSAAFSVAIVADVESAPSPTGRTPQLAWSGKQQFVWNRMRTENHWFYAAVKGAADLTGTAGERYGDYGQFCAYIYQATGTASYAIKAYNKLFAGAVPTTFDPNDSRESFTRRVVWYDWIYPALSSAQRTQGMAHLTEYAKYVLAEGAQYTRGTRIGDTDEMHGHYGGLVALHYLNVPENTRYLNLLNQRVVAEQIGADYPVGGIDATAVDTTTLRNAIDYYATSFAPGGVWYESSEYNAGTSQLVMLLYEVARRAGTGKLPLLLGHLKDAAQAAWYTLVSGNLDKLYWGDEENPREFTGRVWEMWEYFAMLPPYAIEAGRPDIAAVCSQFVEELGVQYRTTIAGAPQYIADAFFKYNPYLTTAALPTTMSAHYASGMGHLYVRGPTSHFWCFGDRVRDTIDHWSFLATSYQVYRNGNWAVTYPIIYAGLTAQAANALQFAGLSTHMMENRQVVRQESGADWHSLTYRNWGRPYTYGNFDYLPGVFVNDWERRYVYFREQGLDIVVIRDVSDAISPTAAPNYSFYSSGDKAAIAAAPAIKVNRQHTNVPATLEAGGFSWTAANGELVRVRTLLPASISRRLVAHTINDFGGYADAYEIKHSVQWWDAAETQVTTFLTVVVCGNGALPAISNSGANSVTVGARTVTFGASSTTVT